MLDEPTDDDESWRELVRLHLRIIARTDQVEARVKDLGRRIVAGQGTPAEEDALMGDVRAIRAEQAAIRRALAAGAARLAEFEPRGDGDPTHINEGG